MTEEKQVTERGLITQDDSIFQSNNKEMFCTMNLEEKENMVALYNSLQECDVKLNDIKGSTIEIKDVFVEKKEVAERDEKTGELLRDEETDEVITKTRFRTILFGTDGKTYVSAAYGVYNSLRQIIPIFGNPSKENPIKVKVGTRKLKSGKESLVLTVVK